jgi:oxidoreductase
MSIKKIKALVIGHTGSTGTALLDILIASTSCESIVAIGRRENLVHKGNPKLTQIILPNMIEIGSLDPQLSNGANAAFCCIGTTFNDVFKNSKAEEYQNVDFGIATGFAQFSKSAGVEFFAIITGDKSDSKSHFRMTRVKGETEDFVRSMNFGRTAILRPGLLNRGKGKRGWLEQIFTVGGIFGLPVAKLAQAMVWMAHNQTESDFAYETVDIKKVISKYEAISIK